jgi:hypothetical protein
MMLVMVRSGVVTFVMFAGRVAAVVAIMMVSQGSGTCGGDRSQGQNANGHINKFFHSCSCRRTAQKTVTTDLPPGPEEAGPPRLFAPPPFRH